VVAVGTTSVRALESAAAGGTLVPYEGETRLFIRPGHRFRVVDVLLTNFHLPESSLLMLVCAFAGRERLDDLRAGVSLHGVLAPDRHLRILGMMCIVREDDDPAFLPCVSKQAGEWLDDRLRPRICELAVDEVVEHVNDDESLHSGYPPFSLRLISENL